MTMKVLIIIGAFLGLLLGGLIFATVLAFPRVPNVLSSPSVPRVPAVPALTVFLLSRPSPIRSADDFQIEVPASSDEVVGASTEDHNVQDPMSDSRLDEYIQLLKRKRFQLQYAQPTKEETRRFTRNLLNEISKYTRYANSMDELQQTDKKTYPVSGAIGQIQKRAQQKEYHVGGCEAKIDWIFLNQHHFPRFVRTYNCTSTGCANGGSCRRKQYPVFVLRMNSPDNISVLDEGCDTHLPEELRCDWKLVPINVTTYCECVSNTNGINSLSYG